MIYSSCCCCVAYSGPTQMLCISLESYELGLKIMYSAKILHLQLLMTQKGKKLELFGSIFDKNRQNGSLTPPPAVDTVIWKDVPWQGPFLCIYHICQKTPSTGSFGQKIVFSKKSLRFWKFRFWVTVRARVVQSSKERCHFEEWDITNQKKKKKKKKKYMI